MAAAKPWIAVIWLPGETRLQVVYVSDGNWVHDQLSGAVYQFFGHHGATEVRYLNAGSELIGPVPAGDQFAQAQLVEDLRRHLIVVGREYGVPGAEDIQCDYVARS